MPEPGGFNWATQNIEEAALNALHKVNKKKPISNGDDLVGDIFPIISPIIIETAKFLKAWPELKNTIPLVAPKTNIGLEVEVENVLRIDPNINTLLWDIKEDGSLRNNGREFVTPGVITAHAAEPALNLLLNGLNKDIDFSRRTSIHVHMDARQLSFKQLLGMLYTYTAVENLLFKFVGNNRRSNIFCVPLSETGVMERMNKNPTEFLYHIEQNWHKYTALNLLPVARYGSVEFRHMPGTTNIRQLINWIDLICCLKVYTYKHSLEFILNEITKLNSNSRYHQFVESVFQDRCIYLDMSNLLIDMEKQVYLIKHCSAANEFDNYVRKTFLPDSQLATHFNIWMKKLKATQVQALTEFAKITKTSDLEYLFKQMVQDPYSWLQSFPRYSNLILATLDKEKIEVPARKIKASARKGQESSLIVNNVLLPEILDNFQEENP